MITLTRITNFFHRVLCRTKPVKTVPEPIVAPPITPEEPVKETPATPKVPLTGDSEVIHETAVKSPDSVQLTPFENRVLYATYKYGNDPFYARDLAAQLNLSVPSVVPALKVLRHHGYVKQIGQEANRAMIWARSDQRRIHPHVVQGREEVRTGKRPPIKEAMTLVMDSKVCNADQVFALLKEKKWLLSSNNPRGYIAYLLPTCKHHFERAPEKGRGFYRVKSTA